MPFTTGRPLGDKDPLRSKGGSPGWVRPEPPVSEETELTRRNLYAERLCRVAKLEAG